MARPKGTPNTSQMAKIADLYYNRNLTKQEIAKQEGLDGRKVSWLLEQAKALGVVRIEILATGRDELATSVIRKFPHLQKVLIVPGGRIRDKEKEYDDVLKRLATVAADYFEEEVDRHAPQKDLRIGISGGETLLNFVNAVPERSRPNVHIHTTALVGLGDLPMQASHIDPSINAVLLWSRNGRIPGMCHFATVPPYDLKEAKGHAVSPKAYIANRLAAIADIGPVKTVLHEMDQIDLAFVAIGIFSPPTESLTKRVTMVGVLGDLVNRKSLADEGAIADLSYCLIDKDGRGRDEWQFFLTAGHFDPTRVGIKFYQRMVEDGKKVVAIAGPYKVPAIRAALRAQAFNVWITDEDSARQIAEGPR